MNHLFCPFRLNVRTESGGEIADCGLIRQQLGIPNLPVAVDRNTCEICCASSRSAGRSNPVLSSLLYGTCDDAINSGLVPADRLPHLQSLYQQAEAQLQLESQISRFERTHSCDVFLCCRDSDATTQRAIESLLDQEDAVAIVHLIDDAGRARQLFERYAPRWNVVIHENPQPLGLFASVQKFFAKCRTQFLAFQTPTVSCNPGRIGQSVSALVRSGAELFAAGVMRRSDACLPKSPMQKYARVLPLETLVVRRATFADMGGFADRRTDADAEFVYRAFCEGRQFELSEECLVETDIAEHDSPLDSCPGFEKRHGSLRHHAIGFGEKTVPCDVVIPFRDHPDMLTEAIESVLAQERADVTVHVIDDSSRENTDELLRYWTSHPRIRTYRNTQNIGQYASFNNVSEYFETDLAVVHDADDISLSHRVHATGNLLRLSDAEFFCAAEYQFEGDVDAASCRSAGRRDAVRQSHYPADDKVGYFALNPTVAFRTSTFNSLNGYADFGEPARNRAGLDSEFQARAWFAGTRFAVSKQIVIRYRLHGDSATQNTETGWGTKIREQSIEECNLRRRLFLNGCEPQVFGGKGAYQCVTKSWPSPTVRLRAT
ncbi:MAG: glycosyltransferase [Planctomycetes bacterium]|nr:glycosyltransferase [Planctomycetota bacterium]